MDNTPVIPADTRGAELAVLCAARRLCEMTEQEYTNLTFQPIAGKGTALVDLHEAVQVWKRYMDRKDLQNAGIASTST